MILNNVWHVLLFASLSTVLSVSGKKAFTAQIVENIVQNEIAKKMPAASGSGGKKKSLTGVHLKEATDAINKLVDESIVDRVQEAEKEVSQMLLKSIEHHIQDAGKVLLKQDENTCRDKLESCDKLSEAGVCESSKDAMVINCPATCNFCGMLEDLKNQAKVQESKHEEEAKPKPSPKRKAKHKKLRKHHKSKHHHSVKSTNLAPEEVRLIHENMLDQAIDHANLPMAVSGAMDQGFDATAPEHENSEAREYEEDQKEAQVEEDKEKELEQEQKQQQQRLESERKRRKSARKQKFTHPSASEGNYAPAEIPPNPAGHPENVQTSLQQDLLGQQAVQQGMPMQYDPNTMTMQYLGEVAGPSPYNAMATGATKRQDLANGTKKSLYEGRDHKKVAQKTLSSKLMIVNIRNSKKKTDIKLKHEIENMVDKAFGELLL